MFEPERGAIIFHQPCSCLKRQADNFALLPKFHFNFTEPEIETGSAEDNALRARLEKVKDWENLVQGIKTLEEEEDLDASTGRKAFRVIVIL